VSKKRKVRVELRKNRSKPPREQGWTKQFHEHGYQADEASSQGERIRAKGDLSRRRTIITDAVGENVAKDGQASADMIAVDLSQCLSGRVLKVYSTQHVVVSTVEGKVFRCALRRLFKSLAIDERSVVATGDRVWFSPSNNSDGFIEKVEPRYGILTRASYGKEQILVANVDQLVIVTSLAEPALKPHLVDRYLVCACMCGVKPVICFNKADLVEQGEFQQNVGMYAQLGIPSLLTSADTGQGMDQLRELLKDCQTVFAGQSGVGKSSLLNAVQPGLQLRVGEVSESNQKGKHTTTTAELHPLEIGGWVVDTPGVRQFDLWNIIPEHLDGCFTEFTPHVARCRFPGCSHTHEEGCGVKEGLEKGWISSQRYESYYGIYTDKKKD
jgi:ribosome biogenesis GTPase / thiamine phosphate phosphatase